jgi:hypothetical protein
MKWGTPDHPKTSNLCGLLKVGVAQACGHLELLWHWVAKYRADGSLEGLEDHSIAAACRWEGDASLFVRALERAKWLDVSPMRRVHDWSEHAENAVHSKLARAGMLFCDGEVPKVGGLDGKSAERRDASRLLAEARARWEVETSLPAGSPRSPRGESMDAPRLAVAVALETNSSTTAPPTPSQRKLAMGPTPVPPRPTQPAENVEALTRNITDLAEIMEESFDRVALWVTSGEVNGRRVCKGTLSFEGMSDKHMRRSILDSNTALNRLRRQTA